jgi:hypothetical protein
LFSRAIMVQGDAPFAGHYCADPRWVYDASMNQLGAVSAKVATGDVGLLGLKPESVDCHLPIRGRRNRSDPAGLAHHGRARCSGCGCERVFVAMTPNEWHYSADDLVVTVPSRDKEAVSALRIWAHHKEGDSCSSIHMPRWASRITLEVSEDSS